jgi:hypothetical protein
MEKRTEAECFLEAELLLAPLDAPNVVSLLRQIIDERIDWFHTSIDCPLCMGKKVRHIRGARLPKVCDLCKGEGRIHNLTEEEWAHMGDIGIGEEFYENWPK